jgi:hypothetical protein
MYFDHDAMAYPESYCIAPIACSINEQLQHKLCCAQKQRLVLEEVLINLGRRRLLFTADHRRRLATVGGRSPRPGWHERLASRAESNEPSVRQTDKCCHQAWAACPRRRL